MCTFNEFKQKLPSVLQGSQMLVDACQKAFQAGYEQRRTDEIRERDEQEDATGDDTLVPDFGDDWYSAQFEREGYLQ